MQCMKSDNELYWWNSTLINKQIKYNSISWPEGKKTTLQQHATWCWTHRDTWNSKIPFEGQILKSEKRKMRNLEAYSQSNMIWKRFFVVHATATPRRSRQRPTTTLWKDMMYVLLNNDFLKMYTAATYLARRLFWMGRLVIIKQCFEIGMSCKKETWKFDEA